MFFTPNGTKRKFGRVTGKERGEGECIERLRTPGRNEIGEENRHARLRRGSSFELSCPGEWMTHGGVGRGENCKRESDSGRNLCRTDKVRSFTPTGPTGTQDRLWAPQRKIPVLYKIGSNP